MAATRRAVLAVDVTMTACLPDFLIEMFETVLMRRGGRITPVGPPPATCARFVAGVL